MNDVISQAIMFLRLVWARRWQALSTAWIICLLGWAYIATLPDNYVSKTKIYVDTANILRPLLAGLAVENDIESEVALMHNTLMSRPNLLKVLQMTDLDITAETDIELERLLTRLKNRTTIRRVAENLFQISYSSDDPVMARDIVQALLTLFVESNLGENRKDMDAARRFIEQQIEIYEGQLEQAELRLADFKQENMYLLTGQVGYLQRLEGAENNLRELEAQFRDATVRRDTLQSELAAVPQFFEQSTQQSSGPPSDSVLRMLELEERLEDLLSRYTEEHPDVVVLKRRLDAARQQYEKELARFASATEDAEGQEGPVPANARVSNTIYEQLKVALVSQEAEIATLKQRIAEAGATVEKIRSFANNVPKVEARLTKLNRDYDVLKGKYEELLSRREAERISRARQAGVEDVQFRVAEPPEVPAIPSGPNRILFFALALVVGLGAGGGLALLLGLASEAISNVAQLREAIRLPVHGSISFVRRQRSQLKTALGAGVFGLATFGLLASFAVVLAIEVKIGFGSIDYGEGMAFVHSVLQV